MTYHISVKQEHIKEFLQIISSLQSLGVVESYSSAIDLINKGDGIEDSTLLNIIDHSNKEIEEGNCISHADVKKQIEAWKKK